MSSNEGGQLRSREDVHRSSEQPVRNWTRANVRWRAHFSFSGCEVFVVEGFCWHRSGREGSRRGGRDGREPSSRRRPFCPDRPTPSSTRWTRHPPAFDAALVHESISSSYFYIVVPCSNLTLLRVCPRHESWFIADRRRPTAACSIGPPPSGPHALSHPQPHPLKLRLSFCSFHPETRYSLHSSERSDIR